MDAVVIMPRSSPSRDEHQIDDALLSKFGFGLPAYLKPPSGPTPKGMRRRKKADTGRLLMLLQTLPPSAARYINPYYYEAGSNPATQQPKRERARRVLADLFPDRVPDPATLSNKELAKKVNDFLKAAGQPQLEERTIRRAADRR